MQTKVEENEVKIPRIEEKPIKPNWTDLDIIDGMSKDVTMAYTKLLEALENIEKNRA